MTIFLYHFEAFLGEKRRSKNFFRNIFIFLLTVLL